MTIAVITVIGNSNNLNNIHNTATIKNSLYLLEYPHQLRLWDDNIGYLSQSQAWKLT